MSDDQGPRKDDDERVGYGRPPKHSRFKPGNRANPAGRGAQKREDFAASIERTLASKVEVRQGAKKRIATRSEGNILSLFDAAKRGKVGAANRILDLFESAAAGGRDGPTTVEIINGLPDAAGEYSDRSILVGWSKPQGRK